MASPHVFSRGGAERVRIDHGHGAQLVDVEGRSYLDAAGGAVVVGIGHGRTEVVEAAAAQASRVAYVHGSSFSSEVLEEYADTLAPLLPLDDPRIYPVSGGSEAVESALKMARAYHLARGEDRDVVIGRQGSYHGNTRGALSVSGRAGLRRPYLPWLTGFAHTSTPYEYRCPYPDTHPGGCAQRHAEALEQQIQELGPGRVAAFIAEPISGAGLGACVPPDDYWPAIAEVCRRHGVLVIADEVMTGFGRTGTWFASEHFGLRPDLLTAGKGTASGYWPLGLAVVSGPVHETLREGGFVHGFTYSHHVVGAATGLAVLRVLERERLVEASARQGERLHAALRRELEGVPGIGDVRGRGLLQGVELVADPETREPFEREERVIERVLEACREHDVLVYPGNGCADGRRGDLLLLGPPFVVTDGEVDRIAAGVAAGIRDVLGQGPVGAAG
ncbi:Adenosylmethionine-8-amino-7-oxononanoate aminotransferase [Serinicoccus hydrothermalis]|uniref:Adenosylmethionine-8-amino-7-oxononanoate aminotransferase n=1 Tax=Serinicoccus hydrothermalis TaxID=1758689 RepID=A0A1B1NA52_9MICO|nr:aminotransferase class III-fold pyridoxal phosphate-dependent enzyme [Serinicoccus hydrothermalis]ANS78255.1 Adenosylmethionine-8-amino-7-oxononanoate aminotransferase [Serinicoccus hydrothermalis]